MLLRSLRLIIFALTCTVALSAPKPSVVSSYTDLSPQKCKTIKIDKQTGGSVQKCTGVAGYNLTVLDDDARQSVNVITPDGEQHELNYWGVVTGAFSSLGPKAEWRMVRKGGKLTPIALIIRVYANENPDSPNQRTSYLAVAKITSDKICVTAKIKASTNDNAEARRVADASAVKPCLQQG
jgi:hypothetical protein